MVISLDFLLANSMTLKAVIFDFDDTLVHSGETSYQTHCLTAKALGLAKPSRRTFLKFWGKPWHSMVLALFPDYDTNKFIQKYLQLRKRAKYPLILGALDTIDFLFEHNIKLGILSNKPSDQLWERIHHTSLNPKTFSFVFGEQDTKFMKPDSRVFWDVLNRLKRYNIRLDEILYVGDLTVDYFAARGAGIKFVGVLSGFHNKKKFLKEGLSNEHLIQHVGKLPEWLVEHKLVKD